MTSDRKTQANRANSRLSAGRKTPRGRARSAKNAFRHGLSLPVLHDSELSEEVKVLAGEIAEQAADAKRKELARNIAEAQVDLRRARIARHQVFSNALANPKYESR